MRLVKPNVSVADCTRQVLAVIVAGSFFFQQTAQAAEPTTVMPTGGAYVAGAGSIKSSGNAVTINQSSLKGIIDWSTFSIGQSGTVTFRNGSGATLNRVTGNQMSSIFGSLLASGSVYVINPEGILIGHGAHVNTGGDFVASTLSLPADTFMKGGDLTYQGTSSNVVVNLGNIFSSGGSVFLIGHGVTNSGNINANGTVGLAAGSEVLIKDSTGDQRVFVKSAGGDVTNGGSIAAAQAELRAKGGNVYALAGNNSVIAATGTATLDGKVWLVSDGGSTSVAGTVFAQNANGLRGSIETSGQNLDISKATVKTGQGGNWLMDPDDQTIDGPAATVIENSLATTNVTISTSSTVASGPGIATTGNGDINLNSSIAWSSNNSFNVSAYRDINVATGVTIANTGAGNLLLRADNSANGTGTVNLNGTSMLDWSGSTGIISILYNPTDPGGGGGGGDARGGGNPLSVPASGSLKPFTTAAAYGNPTDYSAHVLTNNSWTAPSNQTVSNQFTAYMLVNSGSDLANVLDAGNFALGTDLDISSNSNFTELGTISPGFSGIFDGFGHTINGLTMSANDTAFGLFRSVIQGGIVRNLNLTNINVTDATGNTGDFGGLVGDNNGTLANINVSGSVQNANSPYVTGGVVGYNEASGLIYNVQSSVAVNESSALTPLASTPGRLQPDAPLKAVLGGIAGKSDGTIVNSTSSGTLTGNGFDYIGGLVGQNTGSISNSSASSNVSDNGESPYIGGLVGYNTGTLTGVSATGSVTALGTGGVYAGGLIGYNNGVTLTNLNASGSVTTSDNSDAGGLVGHSDGEIDNSHATGAVTSGNGSYAGGLVGFTTFAVNNSYATGNVTAGSGSTAGGLSGWSYFSNISGSNATGAVTAGDNSSVGGLAGRLDGDDGVDTSYATGTVTAGLTSTAGGLIGKANANVTGSNATGNVTAGDGSTLGGLVGASIGAVSNSNASGTVSTSTTLINGVTAGGLIGSTSGTIDSSYATGAVSIGDGSTVGGLVGSTTANITNSHALGNVSGGVNNQIGGLVGYTNAAVSGSYASGNVSALGSDGGPVNVGGLVGLVDTAGSISNSQANGSVTSTGAGGNIGGLAGRLEGSVTSSTAAGPVSGGDYVFVGGLFGEADSPLSNLTATANVSGGIWSQVGGMVGHMTANADSLTASGNVTAGYGSNAGGLIANTVANLSNSSASGTVTGAMDNFVGGLVGYANGAISGSQATGNVIGVGDGGNINSVGGLLGYLDNAGSLTSSQASGTATVTGNGSNIGGLVGTSHAAVNSSSAAGAVTASDGNAVGGLVGLAYSTIDSSFATGNVLAGNYSQIGGLVGNVSAAVTNSYAHGSVTVGANSLAGGLIGYTSAPVSNANATGNVTATGGAELAGGLIARADPGSSVSASTASGQVQSLGGYGSLGGLIGLSYAPVTTSSASGSVMGGNATWIGGLIGESHATVDSSNASGPVTGTTYTEAGGLIGSNFAAVTSSYATGAVSAEAFSWVGGLVGGSSSTISNSNASGTVTGTDYSYIGGLLGFSNPGAVSGSFAVGNVTGGNNSSIGGLIGQASDNITNSYATGIVTGGAGGDVGGLAGYSNATISGSQAYGNVSSTGSSATGGLVGLVDNAGSITTAQASGTVTATGTGGQIGGLVGRLVGTATSSTATGAVTGGDGSFTGGVFGEADTAISGFTASANVQAGNGAEVGGLVGSASQGVSNSTASGNVTGGNGAWVGGLIGAGPSLSASSASGNVTGANSSYVGGLGGHVGSIDGSSATGLVSAGASSYAGGLAGSSVGGISNSWATGDVTAADTPSGRPTFAGGLAGLSVPGEGYAVSNSYATGNVTVGVNDAAGGLVGDLEGAVTTSYATGQVQAGNYSYAGGLTAFTDGSIDSSYATGNVSVGSADINNNWGAASAGGLIGFGTPSAIITNSHATGTVTGGDYSTVGGLAGFTDGAISQSNATGSVTAGIATNAGGLVGVAYGPVSNSYATGNVTVGSGINYNNDGPTPGSYAGGLVGESFDAGSITNSHATGTVVGGDFSYAGGLVGWAGSDVSTTWATGNATVGGSSSAGGLVGGNSGNLNQSYATGNASAGDNSFAGGLSGVNGNGSIETSYATGNVSAGTSATANGGCPGCTSAGGLVGQSYGSISTSFSTGNVSGFGVGVWVGGLAGAAGTGSNISQSYSTSQVNATGASAIAGGLVGDTQSAVTDSYATGAVTVSGTGSIAGGLVGVLDVGTMANPGAPSVATSYSIGAVSGADTNGGLIGQNQGSSNITAAYWDTTSSGQTTSAGGTGLTTSQWVLEGPVAAADTNWNFADTWVQGYPYPVLKAFPYVVATIQANGTRTYGQSDPGFSVVSATDQNGNDALSSIQGTLTPVTVPQTTHVGTYNAGGIGQNVPGAQLTYLGALTIDPLTIILGGLNANNKVYDGTTAATLALDGLNVANLVGSDNITLNASNASGSFADKNAGTGKTVDVTGITLSGPDAANYIISPSYQTTANITPATLTATFNGNNKVYDGTTTATASSVSSLSGVIGQDSVSLQSENLNFASPNAGGVNPISASSYSLSGPDAGNYVVNFVQNGSASITPATLYYVGQPGTNRPYGASNPAFSGTVTGFVGSDTLASTTTGTPVFSTTATTASDAGSYALDGSGLTLTTGNYVLAQAPGNATAFAINPITISIGNVSRFAGSPNPTFTINYSGPITPYLQSVLASLVLVTNAPAAATAGNYQITALIPAALAGDILVAPGTLSILANIDNSTDPNAPQSIATLPAVLQTQAVAATRPLTPLTGSSSDNLLLPPNASGMFQVVITPSPDWSSSGFAGTQGNALSQASFTEKSPDGRSKNNKSTYAAGAH